MAIGRDGGSGGIEQADLAGDRLGGEAVIAAHHGVKASYALKQPLIKAPGFPTRGAQKHDTYYPQDLEEKKLL